MKKRVHIEVRTNHPDFERVDERSTDSPAAPIIHLIFQTMRTSSLVVLHSARIRQCRPGSVCRWPEEILARSDTTKLCSTHDAVLQMKSTPRKIEIGSQVSDTSLHHTDTTISKRLERRRHDATTTRR
ncbi:hypothetical protein THAOC_00300, partial [Thalassiosira oceanica]